MARNFCLTVEYDGTDFKGWQVQPGQRTVQGEIESAIHALFGCQIRITGAGRTDAGVHALGQVASFSVSTDLAEAVICRALNGLLPRDIVVKAVQTVSADFNARRHARSREYEYQIARTRCALGRQYAWQYAAPLDVAAMQEAAGRLLGEKDFTSLCVCASERDNRVCRVSCADLVETDGLLFRIVADRFLRGMVRAAVGTLIQVGRGKRDPSDIDRILNARDRSAAGPSAPAEGLCLRRVSYDHSSGE